MTAGRRRWIFATALLSAAAALALLLDANPVAIPLILLAVLSVAMAHRAWRHTN
jgi:hypothetical protein